ncbi:MAG: hypothetical protein AAFV59_09085, partial [Pseudomonadota bacterium]
MISRRLFLLSSLCATMVGCSRAERGSYDASLIASLEGFLDREVQNCVTEGLTAGAAYSLFPWDGSVKG